MIKIAITGGIASGKSLVERLFCEKGAATLDTDKVVHELLENNTDVITAIKELFANYKGRIINNNGCLDRNKIGKIVFSNKNKLKELESIIHPEVKHIVETFFTANKEKEFVVVSVPLLFESGMEKMFDYVVAVTASDEIRLQRLMETRGMPHEDALKRMSAQDFGQDKIDKADFVIENNNSIRDANTAVENILEKVRTR